MVVPSCLEQMGGGGVVGKGRRVSETGESQAKNPSKKYAVVLKISQSKQLKKFKAVEKLVLLIPFLLINNKAPKVLDAQVEYIP